MMKSRCHAILAFALVLAASGSMQAFAAPHFFTVRDSIEMARPYPDDERGSVSPDGKYIAIVTSRGILASDKTESTIWLFKTSAVQRFLRNGATAPKPVVLARIAVVPRSSSGPSYPPVIYKPTWLPDSSGMLFQGEGNAGERRLYSTDIASGKTYALTPPGYDTAAFAAARGAIAAVVGALPARHPGTRINADAVDLTGHNLVEDLAPQGSLLTDGPPYGNLWIFRNGRKSVVRDDTGVPIRVSTMGGPYFAEFMVFNPSPDGRTIATVIVPKHIPALWNRYQLLTYSGMALTHYDPRDPQMRVDTMQYALVDVATGKVRVPSGEGPAGDQLLGRVGGSGAYWSPDGSKLVFQSTFLDNPYPCIAAVLDVKSLHQDCLKYATAQSYDAFLKHSFDFGIDGVTFGKNNAITLAVEQPAAYPPPIQDETFGQTPSGWKLTETAPHAQAKAPGGLSIAFEQDLNTAPVLWAADSRSGVSRKLWDPNPQLAGMNLGKASVFRWKDGAGRDWVGGLVLPPDYQRGKRYPLVLQTHGFDPTSKEFLAEGFATTANAARPLASAGIITLQMDRDYEYLFTGSRGIDSNLRGITSAIERLSAMGLVDPSRVGAIGFSVTGWDVETTMVRYPNLLKAASINEGSTMDYFDYIHNADDNGALTSQPVEVYGAAPFGAGLAAWVKNSPGFNLDRVKTPLLIGTGHGAAGIVQEWNLYGTLRLAHKPVDLMLFPDGDHVLHKPLERLASEQTNVDWFRFWLQGYIDPDPSKATEYARWKLMKKMR